MNQGLRWLDRFYRFRGELDLRIRNNTFYRASVTANHNPPSIRRLRRLRRRQGPLRHLRHHHRRHRRR